MFLLNVAMDATDVETAMVELHRAAGVLASYLQDSSTVGSTGYHTDLIQSFLGYVRAAVSSAADGSIHHGAAGPKVVDATMKGTLPISHEEGRRLRAMVTALNAQLEMELRAKAAVVVEQSRLTRLLEELRLEKDLSDVLKQRIKELVHKGADCVSVPGEVSADCRIAAERSQVQQVATELGRVTAGMKERHDRHKAEVLKLRSDKLALLAENALLFEKSKLLQEQLYTMSQSASMSLRQLQRERVSNASAAAVSRDPVARRTMTPAGSTSARKLPGDAGPHVATLEAEEGASDVPKTHGSIRIDNVVIDRDMALWMKDMYVALAQDPETAGMLPFNGKPPAKPLERPRSFSAHVASVRAAQKERE